MIKAWPNVRRLSAVALLATASCCLAVTSHAAEVKVSPVRSADSETSTADTYYLSARTAIDRRDYATALDLLQVARARSPNDVRILNAFGVVYDKLGRFDLSARYYAQARALDPASQIVAQNLAYSLSLQGQSTTAPNSVRMAAGTDATSPAVNGPASAAPEAVVAATDSQSRQTDQSNPNFVAINSTDIEVITSDSATIQRTSTADAFQPSAAELRSWSPTLVRISTAAADTGQAVKTAPDQADPAHHNLARSAQGWVAAKIRIGSTVSGKSTSAGTSVASAPIQQTSTVRIWTPATPPADAPPPVTLASSQSSPIAESRGEAAAPHDVTPPSEGAATPTDRHVDDQRTIAKEGSVGAPLTRATWPGTSEPRQEPKWVSAGRRTAEGHRVVVMPRHPGRVLQSGAHASAVQAFSRRPIAGLVIVNASGQADRSAHIRDGLIRLRWSKPALFAAGDRRVAVTTLTYPEARAKVARALARSLPGHARLVVCRAPCRALRLVLGTDSTGWRSMDARTGVQRADTMRSSSKRGGGHLLSTASPASPNAPQPGPHTDRMAQHPAHPWKL